jgi:hypothetical protein
MMSSTRVLASQPHKLVHEVAAFWPKYLWHHRQPLNRTLHQLGSWICIAGLFAAVVSGRMWVLPLAIGLGYGCAFLGHYAVERNRPLTLGNPILAGICNWIMFWLELSGRLRGELDRIALDPPGDSDGVPSY